MPPLPRDAPDRFWPKVERTNACWLWRGHRYRNGYGGFLFEDRDQKAHRVAWVLAYGPIPESALVLHRCDRRECVRPDHLFLGSAAENTLDMMTKGRNRNPGPKKPARGRALPQARLTEDAVRTIRKMRIKGHLMKDIGTRFGVHIMTISDILREKTWRHVS